MRTKLMKLQMENSRENWLMYLQNLVDCVEGVESIDDGQNLFFKDDRTAVLNGEKCYSITNDGDISSILLNGEECYSITNNGDMSSILLFVEEPHDAQVDVLWKIVEFTEENYKVDVLEDVKC